MNHLYRPHPSDASSDLDATLLECAIDLMSEDGLRAATTRAVAERAGVNRTQIHRRFGSQSVLIERAFEHALDRDASVWTARWAGIARARLTHANLATLFLAVLQDDMIAHHRIARVRWMCLISTGRSGARRATSAAWMNASTAFWSKVLDVLDLDRSHAPYLAALLFSIGKGLLIPGPSLTINAWVRDATLRLAERMLALPPSQPGDSPWRDLAESSVQDDIDALDVITQGSTCQRIVDGAVEVVLTRGADKVTHRAIAKTTGLSLSSLTHHFASLDDILAAACREILRRIHERETSTVTGQSASGGAPSADALQRRLSALLGANPALRRDAAAIQEVMMAAARTGAARPISVALWAQTGTSSSHVLEGLANAQRKVDRLDGQILSHIVGGLLDLSACASSEDERPTLPAGAMRLIGALWL